MPIRNPRWLPPQFIVLTQDHIWENTEIFSSLKLLNWLNLNCASIIGRSFTNFVFFYVDRNSKMTTTAGHSFYIGPIGSFYSHVQVNDTDYWDPLVITNIKIVLDMAIKCNIILYTKKNFFFLFFLLLFEIYFHSKQKRINVKI